MTYYTHKCKIDGHWYKTTTSDNVRQCRTCGKVQIKHQGVWMDKPKEPLVRKQKHVDALQMNMLDLTS